MSSLLLLLLAPALACGPFLPDCLLSGEIDVTEAPVGDFSAALHAMGADDQGMRAATTTMLEADRLDAIAALAGVPEPRRTELLDEYTRARAAMTPPPYTWPPPERPWAAPPVPSPSPDLPAELTLWLVGAAKYRLGDEEGAVAAFEDLLALPPDRRQRKTVWAEFMLGRLGPNTEARVAHLQAARQAVRDGFADSFGLGCESLGQEALETSDPRRRLELYLAQVAAGERGGVASLVAVGHEVFDHDGETLDALVLDPVSAEVIAAWIVSRGAYAFDDGPESPRRRWQAAVESTGSIRLAGADRLAQAAYANGAPEEARRWAELAPEAPMSRWILAKLALRDGDAALAAELMPRADELRLPDAEVAGERGVALLAQQRYVEALESFLASSYWLDTAYVAERVLTVEELTGFVDARYPAPLGVQPVPWGIYDCDGGCPDPDRIARLRWLLARRLAREGRLDDAARYAPPAYVGWYRFWARLDALRTDPSLPDEERGLAAWHEALILRHLGMELRGTELDSDFAAYEGRFTQFLVVDGRLRRDDALGPGTDERLRVERSVSLPDRRFHYRWLAAEMAWEAASFLPDGDERTAQMLCVGGGWIHFHDPDGSWKFWLALQNRTPDAELVLDGGWYASDGYRCSTK